MTLNKLWMRAVLAGLCLAATHLQCTASPIFLDISVTDISSHNELGSPGNTRLEISTAANARLIGIQWTVRLEAFDPSWLSEVSMQIAGSNALDVVTLQPGTGFEASGEHEFTGSADLTLLPFALNTGLSGRLWLEFFETLDDFPGAADGVWRTGNIRLLLDTPAVTVPEPSTLALVSLIVPLILWRSKRRRLAETASLSRQTVSPLAITLVTLALGSAQTAYSQPVPETRLIYSDTFAETPLVPVYRGTGPFLVKYGNDVTHAPGLLSIRQNVTDTYARVESTPFWPSELVRIKLTHRMMPSPSYGTYFFPSVSFRFSNGQGLGFLWLRSAYSSDYCGASNGYDKVILRISGAPHCVISNIASSTLYNQEITSTITFDVIAKTISYTATTSERLGAPQPLASYTFNVPAQAVGAITGANVHGYGWFTGHGHDLYRLEVSAAQDRQVPASPVDRHASERTPSQLATKALSTTSPPIDNFAKRWYWEEPDLDGKKKNHLGSDLALTNGGKSTVDSDTFQRPVLSICDNGQVIDAKNSDATGLTNVLLVQYANCAGRAIRVYYGHMNPTVTKNSTVNRGDIIGTVAFWGSNSHLHVTVDTLLSRNLITSQPFYLCNYTVNASNEVTALSNCSDSSKTTAPGVGQALITLGWGKLTVLSHRPVGSPTVQTTNLYVLPVALTNSTDARFRFIPLNALVGI